MKKKIITNKNKGILFWITGLSGSGKTTISKKIKIKIAKLYGPTLMISGDNLRKMFQFKKDCCLEKNFVNLQNSLLIKKLI